MFSIELLHQAIERKHLFDDVYLAIAAPDTTAKRRNWRNRQRGNLKLCRLLGLGLMLVDPARKTDQACKVLLDPAPYTPRKNKRQQTRLMAEFTARTGDPNTGGVTRTKIITAYRQDALQCASELAESDELKVSVVRERTGVERAGLILRDNHYGWFDRVKIGHYDLSPKGRRELANWSGALESLAPRPSAENGATVLAD